MMIIESKGLVIKKTVVPKFNLSTSSIYILDWPNPYGGKAVKIFYDLLTGKRQHDAICIKENAAIACQLDKEFLSLAIGELNLSPYAITSIFHKNNIDVKSRVLDFPLTTKVLLAIELACSNSKVVVFNTAGLDPAGDRVVSEYVKDKAMKKWSFIQLRFPTFKHDTSNNIQRKYRFDS